MDGSNDEEDDDNLVVKYTETYSRPEVNSDEELSRLNDYYSFMVCIMCLAGECPSWRDDTYLLEKDDGPELFAEAQQKKDMLVSLVLNHSIHSQTNKHFRQNIQTQMRDLLNETENQFIQEFIPIIIALLEKMKEMEGKPEHEITGIEMKNVLDEKCAATNTVVFEWANAFQNMTKSQL